jgi:hypothetical protein
MINSQGEKGRPRDIGLSRDLVISKPESTKKRSTAIPLKSIKPKCVRNTIVMAVPRRKSRLFILFGSAIAFCTYIFGEIK